MTSSGSRPRFTLIELSVCVTGGGVLYAVLNIGGPEQGVLAALSGHREALYGTLAAVAGALLGFVIATLAIVVGYVETPRFEPIKQSRHYSTLYLVFTSAIRALGAATVVALAALVVDRDSSPSLIMFVVVVATSALATLRLIHCVWTLERMIDVMVTAKSRKPGE